MSVSANPITIVNPAAESLDEPLPKPAKDECFVCKAKKEGHELQRCSKCRTVPYCSKACQTSDWKEHKKICLVYISQNAMDFTKTHVDGKGRSKKDREHLRSRGDIIRDLSATANAHNGDTFTVVCWHALNLVRNINKAKTHFFAMTLSRNFDATNPRAMHSLIDAAVLPLSVLQDKFSNMGVLAQDAQGSHKEVPFTPLDMLRQNEQERLRDGGLGAVMVVSVELSKKEKGKSVEQAVRDTMCPTFQPLGLFKVHQDSMKRMPSLIFEERIWKQCLRNALDGYAYAHTRQPSPYRMHNYPPFAGRGRR
ncbi:MYND-type domain-containing protein [Mycena kentingensis (nom. inval.)]|nr:MYND-type domain-containing protein [Mycena kentingensis (nom. inval.)]